MIDTLPPCTPHSQAASLINDCWADKPEHRPSFGDILTRLGNMSGLAPSMAKLADRASAGDAC